MHGGEGAFAVTCIQQGSPDIEGGRTSTAFGSPDGDGKRDHLEQDGHYCHSHSCRRGRRGHHPMFQEASDGEDEEDGGG